METPEDYQQGWFLSKTKRTKDNLNIYQQKSD